MDSERQRRIDDLVALALILCALVGLGLASGLWLLVIPLVLLTLWQPLLSKRVRISDPPLLVYLLVALPLTFVLAKWAQAWLSRLALLHCLAAMIAVAMPEGRFAWH